ncbi:MAG: response regulator [Acidimicrobiia bacterium]
MFRERSLRLRQAVALWGAVSVTYDVAMPRDVPLVLVVDDEPLVREVVCRYLQRDGFAVAAAADGSEAMELYQRQQPDLVVLDLMLPIKDGLSILTEMRQASNTPVILLSARRDEADRVQGLELGADDYVVKPFSPRELSARVRSVLRRTGGRGAETGRLDFDNLSIDRSTRDVVVREERVQLTPKEFDLLAFLAESPRQVFSRGQILKEVWDSSPDWQDPATVTVHVRRLRQKIEVDPEQPRWLVTVWGVGYRFEP